MKKLLKYVPFHFLLCLITGIYLQHKYTIYASSFKQLFIIISFSCIILFLVKNTLKKVVFTFISFTFFILIGISATYINNPKNHSSYYQNQTSKNFTSIITIQKRLKPNKYYEKFIAEVSQIDSIKTKGNILLNIKRDSLKSDLKIDDKLYIKTVFKAIKPPLNPYQFDYKNYLTKQYVYQQIFIDANQFKKLDNNRYSLLGLAAFIRNKIKTSLEKYNFKNNQLSVINALLLGQRQEVSKNLIQNYTNAGAIHILAISGLHIGILLLMLSFILKPLERLKYGSYIKAFIIVLFLWLFAFIAGLSASVVRAVTMFTFVAIGTSFKRNKIIEHSLISSMFFLLLIKPLFLFDVGFQLSYLAVFGIIWTQPFLYNLWKPKFILTDKFWQLITVSIAAQVGILPISLYYFHQFPALFILSNLIIIPFLGSILIGGILIILLSLLNILPQFLADFYGIIISLMNQFVSWISSHEEFVFKEISMSFYEMAVWYFVIILGFQFIFIKKAKQLIYFLSTVFILQSVYITNKYIRKNKHEFVVFHQNKKSLIGIRNSDSLKVYLSLNDTTNNYNIKAYKINQNIKTKFYSDSKDVFKFKNQHVLIIDSLVIYKNINIKNAIIVLQNSPKVNLNRVIKLLNPSTIIADGSNYKSYIKQWNVICNKQKTPFYHTGKNGAYIIK